MILFQAAAAFIMSKHSNNCQQGDINWDRPTRNLQPVNVLLWLEYQNNDLAP